MARRRQPNLILIDIDRHASEIATLSKDLQAQVPDSAIAGTFTPDRLEQGQSEGATIIELLRAQVRDFLRRPLSTTELRAVLDRLFSRFAGFLVRDAGANRRVRQQQGRRRQVDAVGECRLRPGAPASR